MVSPSTHKKSRSEIYTDAGLQIWAIHMITSAKYSQVGEEIYGQSIHSHKSK